MVSKARVCIIFKCVSPDAVKMNPTVPEQLSRLYVRKCNATK